jgi:hypothetical protein
MLRDRFGPPHLSLVELEVERPAQDDRQSAEQRELQGAVSQVAPPRLPSR